MTWKISELPTGSALTGAELIELSQSGTSIQATVSDLPTTSDAIIAALTADPAVIPNGTVAAPGLAFASDATSGFYTPGTAASGGKVLGFAQNGKALGRFQYRASNFGENVWVQFGTGTTYPNQVSDVYATTISAVTAYMANGAESGGYVALDLGSSVLHFTDSGNYLGEFVEHEMDKLDLYADDGAVTVAMAGTSRFTAAVPHTDVTITRNHSIRIGGNSGVGEGTTTNYYGILFTGHAWLTGTNNYGIFFDEEAPDGDIATADGIPFQIISSVSDAGIAAGQIDLTARNSGGTINLLAGRNGTSNGNINIRTASSGVGTTTITSNTRDNAIFKKDVITFDTDASGQINLNINGLKSLQIRGGTGYLRVSNTGLIANAADGTSASGLTLSSFGAQTVDIATDNTNATQARFTHTASANRYLTFTGSNGGNPTIGTSAGSLLTSARLLTTASATGGSGFNLPHGAAPTSPVDGDMWTTTAGLFVRINGSTVGPLS